VTALRDHIQADQPSETSDGLACIPPHRTSGGLPQEVCRLGLLARAVLLVLRLYRKDASRHCMTQ
jgi:hypothetical protein